jgi:hypothetical protein
MLSVLKVVSVQKCEVETEIEQEKERCHNSTSGNSTSGQPQPPLGVQELCAPKGFGMTRLANN